MRYCPACAKKEYTKITDLNFALFDDLKMSGKMQVVECKDCHFIYNNTALQDNDFFNYYRLNEYYFDSKSSGSGGSSSRDAERYSFIYDQIKVCFSKPNPTIIDFGCGKGGMLNWLSKNSAADLIGIEASASCRAFVKKTLFINVFSSLKEVEGKVDSIILSHVLEHIYSPVKLLKEMKRLSHDGTLIYIEVPSAEAYIVPNINWRELYFEHINHFSKTGLTNMLSLSGLQIIKSGRRHFYQDDTRKSECQYCLAGIGEMKTEKPVSLSPGISKTNQLPAQPIISKIIREDRPVSIWGISQYTQLVLGSYPELMKKIKCLFDSSSAKIGRTVCGVKVVSSEKLSLLGAEDILLVPDSPFRKEMEGILTDIGFSGQIVRF